MADSTVTPPLATRDDVLAELESELDVMLADAPESVTESTRKNIKNESLAYGRRVLDSLSSAELGSEAARQRFLITTLRDAERQVRRF